MKKIRIECDRCHKVITKDLDENGRNPVESYLKLMEMILDDKKDSNQKAQGFAHVELYSFLNNKIVKDYHFCQDCYDHWIEIMNGETYSIQDRFSRAPIGRPIYLIDDEHNTYIGVIKAFDDGHLKLGDCIAGDIKKYYSCNLIDWGIINDDVISQRNENVREMYEKAIEAMKKYAEDRDAEEEK